MTGDRYLANERCDAPCKCCLSIFTNVKVLIINRDSSSGVFCRCEPPTLFSQDPTYDRQFLQRKCLKLKISGCLLLLSSKISTIKAVLLQQRKALSHEKRWAMKSVGPWKIVRIFSQILHVLHYCIVNASSTTAVSASNPREHLDFRSRFLCFQTANQKILNYSKIVCLQSPSILVPRLRRLRDEKRALGTRMGKLRCSCSLHHFRSRSRS